MDTVIQRRSAQKDICVGRKGRWCVSKGIIKQNPSFSQRVNMRSLEMFPAVTAQSICSECVNGDKKDIPSFSFAFCSSRMSHTEKNQYKDRKKRYSHYSFFHFIYLTLTCSSLRLISILHTFLCESNGIESLLLTLHIYSTIILRIHPF